MFSTLCTVLTIVDLLMYRVSGKNVPKINGLFSASLKLNNMKFGLLVDEGKGGSIIFR